MKIFPLAALVFTTMGVTSMLKADRIPIDLKTRTVTDEHIMLEVSDTQAEEMDTQGTLTLTTEQWQLLRNKGLMWPMRLEWIVNYDEDTCGCALMGNTGIRVDEKRVAIVPGYSEIENAEQALHSARDESRNINLRADRRGQFYAEGILIPFRDLLAYFEKPSEPDDEGRQPSLNVSFPAGIERTSAAVKERVDKLEATAKASGWEVQIEKKLSPAALGG